MLMPRIERDGECRPSFPFKGPLRRALIPDSRRAASRGHGDDLFIKLALRFSAFTRIDLGDIGVGYHLIGKSADSSLAILALPILKFFCAHVPHESPADDRNAFRLDPLLVGTVFVHHELDIGMNFEFFCWSCHDYLPDSLLRFS